ncbi:hypothetical protein ACE01N_01760 [Saccharicrinis sp. FJH2]|uniref:hypothetical protein n=1 Tax=Saccharicrinis sp. FJH65 TaxID=3344659 RepID=UPI0035F38A49
MKRAVKILTMLSVFATMIACTKVDPKESNEFTVPFEEVIPVIDNGDGTYNVSNPSFQAGFEAQDDALKYELRIIRQDGTSGDPFYRTADQLVKKDGDLYYAVLIGSITIGLGVNEAKKDEMVADFQKLLDKAKVNYKALSIKVIYE